MTLEAAKLEKEARGAATAAKEAAGAAPFCGRNWAVWAYTNFCGRWAHFGEHFNFSLNAFWAHADKLAPGAHETGQNEYLAPTFFSIGPFYSVKVEFPSKKWHQNKLFFTGARSHNKWRENAMVAGPTNIEIDKFSNIAAVQPAHIKGEGKHFAVKEAMEMKKMRWISAVLALALLVSLTGCGCRMDNGGTSEESTTESQTTEERTTEERTTEETTVEESRTSTDRENGTSTDGENGTGGLIDDITDGINDIGNDISDGLDGTTEDTTRTDTGYTAATE